MKKYNLVSSYTTKQFKVHKSTCNQAKISNIVDRKFDGRQDLEVIVSDLTYVRVGGKGNIMAFINEKLSLAQKEKLKRRR